MTYDNIDEAVAFIREQGYKVLIWGLEDVLNFMQGHENYDPLSDSEKKLLAKQAFYVNRITWALEDAEDSDYDLIELALEQEYEKLFGGTNE